MGDIPPSCFVSRHYAFIITHFARDETGLFPGLAKAEDGPVVRVQLVLHQRVRVHLFGQLGHVVLQLEAFLHAHHVVGLVAVVDVAVALYAV